MGGNEDEIFARRRFAAVIQRPAKGEVRFFDMDDSAPMAFGDVYGLVRRAGIDQDQLDLAIEKALIGARRESMIEPFLLIERSEDDADTCFGHEPGRSLLCA